MLKTVAAGLSALFVTASSLAYAQAPSATTATGGEQENTKLSAADLNALTDARIGIVKAALQLIAVPLDTRPGRRLQFLSVEDQEMVPGNSSW